MRKMSKQWTVRLGALTLAAALCGTGAVLAAGDENDPLVTLSYLEQTAIPQVVERVERSTADKQRALEKALEEQIEQYRQQTVQGGGAQAGYVLVDLADGQVLHMEVGCEALLRVGGLQVSAADSPALIDLSSGGAVEPGAWLEKNHLYLSTIQGRSLVASGAVKVLVRGSYTVG